MSGVSIPQAGLKRIIDVSAFLQGAVRGVGAIPNFVVSDSSYSYGMVDLK